MFEAERQLQQQQQQNCMWVYSVCIKRETGGGGGGGGGRVMGDLRWVATVIAITARDWNRFPIIHI